MSISNYEQDPQDWRVIVNQRGEVVADVRGDRADADMLAASKDMARALLRFLGSGVCATTGSTSRGCIEALRMPCMACEGRAALKKAGEL